MTFSGRPTVLAATLAILVMGPAARPLDAVALEVPYLTGRVVDAAELLSPEARERLSARLEAHERGTTNQIAVLTVPGLEGESIEDFASRVFESWRLGQTGKDNGVLLVVSPADRRLRIEVGYGLEPVLTDAIAGRIIRDVMTPRFREESYDEGVEEGVEAVVAVLEGTRDFSEEAEPAVMPEAPSSSFFEGPEIPLAERFLMGGFIFGIIGLFTVMGLVTPGAGWFIYPFLIPFWAMFPIVVVGVKGAVALLIAYLVLFPVIKVLLPRADWYRRAARDLKTKGTARLGGLTIRSGGSSGGSTFSSGSRSSSSSFSGGGGRSGGGGASGSW